MQYYSSWVTFPVNFKTLGNTPESKGRFAVFWEEWWMHCFKHIHNYHLPASLSTNQVVGTNNIQLSVTIAFNFHAWHNKMFNNVLSFPGKSVKGTTRSREIKPVADKVEFPPVGLGLQRMLDCFVDWASIMFMALKERGTYSCCRAVSSCKKGNTRHDIQPQNIWR